MKKLFLSVMLASAGVASAQTAVTTDVVGYVSLGNVNENEPALPANTDITISIPFIEDTVLSSTVVSSTDDTVVISSDMVSGEFSAQDTPFILVVESGALNGTVALISGNTTDELAAEVFNASDLSALSAGDEISISPATTVGNFLSGNVLPSGVQLLVSDPTVSGINNSAGGVYTLFNGNWLLNLSTVANNDVLYPGESYILRNTTTTDIDSLVVSGKVPSFNSRIVIGANSSTEQQDVNFSYFSPVSEVIGDAGLQASNGDQILFFNNNQTGINNSGSGVLTYFQGQWLFNLSEDVTNSFTFEGGQGYVYRTAPGTPAGFDFISDTQSYNE